MRAQGWGRIVNVGSMNGRFTWPGMGSYCATKHAIEATTDALRHEVRPFGVQVSLIQPGMVKTAFGNAAAERRTAEPTVRTRTTTSRSPTPRPIGSPARWRSSRASRRTSPRRS